MSNCITYSSYYPEETTPLRKSSPAKTIHDIEFSQEITLLGDFSDEAIREIVHLSQR